MKKTTLETIRTTLIDLGVKETDPIVVELDAELSKGQAKKDATVAAYAEIHDAVMAVLAGASDPVTAQEIADETGISRGKIVYGLTHYWKDEVEKDTSGKSTTYAIKA